MAVVGQYDFAPPHDGWYQLLPRERRDVVEPSDPVHILHGPSTYPAYACGATLTWYTNHPGDSVVDYGLDQSYGQTVSDPAAVHQHVVPLTGLDPATTYDYRVRTGGSCPTCEATGSFTTAASPQPSILGAVNASVDSQTVQLIWRTDVPTSRDSGRSATATASTATPTAGSTTPSRTRSRSSWPGGRAARSWCRSPARRSASPSPAAPATSSAARCVRRTTSASA